VIVFVLELDTEAVVCFTDEPALVYNVIFIVVLADLVARITILPVVVV